jgi:hypothetical protein
MNNDVKNQNVFKKSSDFVLLDTISTSPVVTDKNLLLKKARSKGLTRALTLSLIRNNENSELIKSYWNTFYCNDSLSVTETTIENVTKRNVTGRSCKNRWCIYCNHIKTAKYIKGYLPQISNFSDPIFLTLTIPNVSGDELYFAIEKMKKIFTDITDLKSMRGKIKGIRKLEVTHRSEKTKFHPHFHMVLDGKENAELLLNQWMSRYPDNDIKAQNIRIADGNSLIELFKYFTKIFDKKSESMIPPIHLNTIFLSMRNKRVFQTYGGVKKVLLTDNDYDKSYYFEKLELGLYTWCSELFDWFNADNGLCLSNYVPSDNIKNMIDKINNI